MSTSRRSVTVVLALTAVLTSGCEKKIGAVCEEKCGSAADVKTCSDSEATAEATAEERGCESEFEEFASCADAKAVCTNGSLDAAKPCAAEIAALDACVQ
jgi:hypothetical protein